MPEHICNTSPIQYLGQLGLLNLLHELARVVIVPTAVVPEIQAGRLRGYTLPQLGEFDWIVVRTPITTDRIPVGEDLGAGETEVLAIALECQNPIAILDDAAARRTARGLGIDVRGTLGILLDAKKAGLIEGVSPLLDRLQALGLTQRQLAEKLGVNESQVSRDERNEYPGVTLDRAARILKLWGVELRTTVIARPNDRYLVAVVAARTIMASY